MSKEIRIAVTIRLSDDMLIQSLDMHRVTGAWHTFLEAAKELPVEGGLTIGLVNEAPVRRRRGRPRLATVPDSAA